RKNRGLPRVDRGLALLLSEQNRLRPNQKEPPRGLAGLARPLCRSRRADLRLSRGSLDVDSAPGRGCPLLPGVSGDGGRLRRQQSAGQGGGGSAPRAPRPLGETPLLAAAGLGRFGEGLRRIDCDLLSPSRNLVEALRFLVSGADRSRTGRRSGGSRG